MSKYEEIYKKILNKIENGEYKVGDVLPGEFEMMKIFDSSRDTIRKALLLLVQNGYIQKSKGRGSIVLDFNRYDFPVSGVVSFKELASKMNQKVETQVICLEKIHPDQKMKKVFDITDNDYIWMIERVRKIDDEAVILDIDILDAQIIPNITMQIAQNSLYEYIENDLGLTIAYASKEITCQHVSGLDKQLLNINNFDTIVNVESYTHLDDARVFQYTSSRHRPDKFRFIDFARRQKNV
ncbi:MAG: trehalose operon repressor [Coprobacillus sp.]